MIYQLVSTEFSHRKYLHPLPVSSIKFFSAFQSTHLSLFLFFLVLTFHKSIFHLNSWHARVRVYDSIISFLPYNLSLSITHEHIVSTQLNLTQFFGITFLHCFIGKGYFYGCIFWCAEDQEQGGVIDIGPYPQRHAGRHLNMVIFREEIIQQFSRDRKKIVFCIDLFKCKKHVSHILSYMTDWSSELKLFRFTLTHNQPDDIMRNNCEIIRHF